MESYYKIQDEPGTAAIVPHHVIQADDARMLAEDVTDAKGNHTRFIILRKGVLDVENPDLEKQLEELVSNEKGLDADADGTEKAAELTRGKYESRSISCLPPTGPESCSISCAGSMTNAST